MSKRIIGIDFSKVLSPVGISQFLAGELAKYLTIDQAAIRNIYKSHIGELVTNQRSITTVIDELEPFLHEGKTTKDISTIFSTLPPVDAEFIAYLQTFREQFDLYIISDIYSELGEQLKKELHDKFDGFFLSYEFGKKKSDPTFWEKLPTDQIALFVDDKKENIDIASEFNIQGVVYTNFTSMLTFIGTLHAGLTPHDQLVEVLKKLSPDLLLIEVAQEDMLSEEIDSYPDEMIAAYQRASQQGVPVFGFDSKQPGKGIDKELNQKVIKEQKQLLEEHNYTRKDANKPEVLQLLNVSSKQLLIDPTVGQQREETMTENIRQHLQANKQTVVVTGAGHLDYFEQQFPEAAFPFRVN